MSECTEGPAVGGCEGWNQVIWPAPAAFEENIRYAPPMMQDIPPAVTPRVYLAGQALAAIVRDGITPSRMWASEAVALADAVLARLKETE